MLKHQNILIKFGILLILCLTKSYAQDSVCKEGEELKPCGSACEPTCNDTGNNACIAVCIIDKCQCKDGYVRDENKICIPKENCPGARKCVPIVCNLLCRIGYVCKIIYGKPTCVPKCSKGEEYKECPTACEPKCGQKPIFCPAVCLKPPRCQCLPRYARTLDGICVPRNECPQSQNVTTEVPSSTTPLSCGEGEEARSCPVCEATCARKRPICPLYCPRLQRCLCKQGYARVAKGKCIPIEECPEEPTTQKPCILPCPLAFFCKLVNGEPTCVRAKDCSRINCGIAYTCKVIDGGATCVPLYVKSTTETYNETK
uniref:TIL domain-containing protein n=1 Tax=Meloidogyne enterolobii TaxID=390850 RepID=A0A6V7X9Y3_MELEN|nr:unnamed protein product [Meloidogyne enterolobii]